MTQPLIKNARRVGEARAFDGDLRIHGDRRAAIAAHSGFCCDTGR